MTAPGLERLSLNQATTKRVGVAEAVGLCVRHGIGSIGLWREPVSEVGLDEAARLVGEAGLHVSSLCRGGFLTADHPERRAEALDDNRRAIDEAAALSADCLVLVVGGLPDGSRDLAGARRRVADAVAELAPYARERRVQLALEPLHPMYAPDRAVLSTLRQALDIAEPYPAETVGVVVDTFHVWWDPELDRQIARAGAEERIASYQVCDVLVPLPQDVLLGRAMMGDGPIDFASITRAVGAQGYARPVEVEIFNAEVWAADPDAVTKTVAQRYLDLVQPHLVTGG